MPRHPLAHMLAIAAVASAAGIALAFAIDWFPASAATRASQVDRLFDVLLIASVPIFVLVQSDVLYSVWRFRLRPGEELKDGPPTHGNTPLEVLWTAVPGVLIAGLVTYAYAVLDDIERKQPRALTVNVIAQQFSWHFEYPRQSGKPVRSASLYLPRGAPGRVPRPLARRGAQLLRAPVPGKDRRRPEHHHRPARHAHAQWPPPGALRRAVRARPCGVT